MVLPVGDANPTRRVPVLTVALIAGNVAVYFLLQPQGATCEAAAFLYEWAAIPRELLSLDQLGPAALSERLGSSCAATVGDKNVLLSAFSAMFLHANVAHLAFNMLYLWVFGNNVEDRLGHARFVLFYAAGGLAATYVFAFLNAGVSEPLLGASGAVAAILGAYFVLYPRAGVHTYVPFPLYLLVFLIPGARVRAWLFVFAIVTLPAWLVLGMWFGLQVFSSRSPAADGVAYTAHIAGFVAGIVLLLVLDRRRQAHGAEPFHQPGGYRRRP